MSIWYYCVGGQEKRITTSFNLMSCNDAHLGYAVFNENGMRVYLEKQNFLGIEYKTEREVGKMSIESTQLWEAFEKKAGTKYAHVAWMRKVYSAAANYLTRVVLTFPNYTLHDQTHILNVLKAMAGLLGNRIYELSLCETELLILAACLHDVGMVYESEKDKQFYYQKTDQCNAFLQDRHPELIGIGADQWGEAVQQDYLRWLHPFRVRNVLQGESWAVLIAEKPADSVNLDTAIAVCEAHGETIQEIISHTYPNGSLCYSRAGDTDPLFCTILLRLADILDFDDSRAPLVLLQYAGDKGKSMEEWNKHLASLGFTYLDSPSTNSLPYRADCKHPGVERSVRTFLDWIDEELSNSRSLLNHCAAKWKDFPFSYNIDREEINSIGYDYGDFSLTMDQEQVLSLLAGENLYDNPLVFIRELLQNAIDATLLRGRMDPDFDIESEGARIDLSDWCDDHGTLWFRIDDRGIGMTRGMIQRYFLKIGKSYYTSKELIRDLRDHNQTEDYQGISEFGIGFLSCFLCGSEVQVSTLYFDQEKAKRESKQEGRLVEGYGIRMDITGLSGVYVVRNQALGHLAPPLPSKYGVSRPEEENNYRSGRVPGTSIVLRIDPSKLAVEDLKKAAKEYIGYPTMPVYYNGEPLCKTHKQFREWFSQKQQHFVKIQDFEFIDKDKQAFDKTFPFAKGQYPRLRRTIFSYPLDQFEQFKGVSILVCKIETIISQCPTWEYEGRPVILTADNGFNGIRIYGSCLYDAGYALPEYLEPIWQMSLNPNVSPLLPDCFFDGEVTSSQNGILIRHIASKNNVNSVLLCINGNPRIHLNTARTAVKHLPTELACAIAAACEESKIPDMPPPSFSYWSLGEWKTLLQSPAGCWLKKVFSKRIKTFENCVVTPTYEMRSIIGSSSTQNLHNRIIRDLLIAILMEKKILCISGYANGDTKITWMSNDQSVGCRWNILPPILFFNSEDKQYLRLNLIYDYLDHSGFILNVNHPYTRWLLEKGNILKEHYPHQFKALVYPLKYETNDDCLSHLNKVRNQLKLMDRSNELHIDQCPILSDADFGDFS